MGIFVPWLVDAARMAAAGTGKSVIVSPGWQSRGHGGLRVVEVVVGHHTATPESAPGDYPSLNVVRNGRAGLSGPLAQYGLGRSGNIYVIAAGVSHHAGASAYAGFVDLNDESLGIEAEDSGDGRWTADALFMYPRLVGACLLFMRRDFNRYASHRTVAVPRGRKPDPAGISDDWMRQQAAVFLQGGADMAGELADQVIHFMIERLKALPAGHAFKGKHVGDMLLDATGYASAAEARTKRLEEAVNRIETALTELKARPSADVDEAALAAELAARGIGGVDAAQLIDILSKVRLEPGGTS
jgi:hypothetical protein